MRCGRRRGGVGRCAGGCTIFSREARPSDGHGLVPLIFGAGHNRTGDYFNRCFARWEATAECGLHVSIVEDLLEDHRTGKAKLRFTHVNFASSNDFATL